MHKGGMKMALQIAIVEDLAPDARRLEALSRSLTALLKLGENAELNKQPVSDSALFAEALRSLPQAALPAPP